MDFYNRLYSEATINEKDFRRVDKAVYSISSIYGASFEDLAALISSKEKLNALERILIDWLIEKSSSNPNVLELPVKPIWNCNSRLFLLSWK